MAGLPEGRSWFSNSIQDYSVVFETIFPFSQSEHKNEVGVGLAMVLTAEAKVNLCDSPQGELGQSGSSQGQQATPWREKEEEQVSTSSQAGSPPEQWLKDEVTSGHTVEKVWKWRQEE